jgi:Sec-independent protein secretion pathway component TatC
VVGAVVIFLDIGSLYCFGAMAPYITSYLSWQTNTNVQIIDIAIINPISFMMMPIGMIIG